MVSNIMFSAVAGVTLIAMTCAVNAKPLRGTSEGVVKACSQYGHGCTSAPIRRSPVGYELRMPGGTWISCRGDCKQALREEVLDFWETQRERAGHKAG